jgi:phage-related protein
LPELCYLLTVAVDSPLNVVWEGDSLDVISSFPDDVKENLGGNLRRVQNGERPLDSGSMAPVLRGVIELRDDDKDSWYRVLYTHLDDAVYVLHCFKKKTNEIAQKDINTARLRLTALKQRLAAQEKVKKGSK